ncbi:hypothetical protein [Micromonospora sp. CA-111912]|uniref:hypothetical protein n=1 Tax=Micromonospora sp. CA-111912 TaxID=3239955 RepID=UPI003D8B1339
MTTRNICSPERPYKVGLLVVLAIVSFANAAGSEGWSGRSLGTVAGLACALVAWRTARVRVVITDAEVIDVRALATRTFDRSQVASVGVGRPGGILDGYCLVLALSSGQHVPLLGSRVYSWIPAAAHLRRLQDTLPEMRRMMAAG